MNIPLTTVPPLRMGDVLTQEEFLRRWEAMPELKFAELIGGVVYMPSPLGFGHGRTDFHVAGWLGVYAAATPGVEGCNDATWIMGRDVPQPDTSLFVTQEYGGRARMRGPLLEGAPEFAVEVCVTSAAYDLHQKLQLYERQGVEEYLAVLVHEHEVRWHRLEGGRYTVVPVPADGIHRSTVFPGLWLDVAALLADDLPRLLAVVTQGTRSD